MKKRILIAIHYMELGGAEISLIGLLQAMDYSKYDVDLFIYSHRGYLMRFIPEEVNVLPEIEIYSLLEAPLRTVLQKGYVRLVFRRAYASFRKSIYLRSHPNISDDDGYFKSKITTPLLPFINFGKKYDVAISFLTPHFIVRDKVIAIRKFAWIHTDYSTLKLATRLVFPMWSRFDRIIAVSEDVKHSFAGLFPQLSERITCLENILSSTFVRSRALEDDEIKTNPDFDFEDGSIKILSIGRFSQQKNFDSIPIICKLLIDKGFDIRWYLIGYGSDLPLIRQRIRESGMEKFVIILGKKMNPYPYIKACDYYVQPSRYEGKAVTVREAQMLYKPVIITNYPTAKGQIVNDVDGVIVPLDNQGCADGIGRLIVDQEKRKKLIDYLEEHDYGNVSEIHNFDSLLEDEKNN